MARAAADKAANGLAALLRRCHALLIAPLAEALKGEEHLLIVPDRDLYALPFAALLESEAEGGKHLIERVALSVAPSIGTVLELGPLQAGQTR